jgi:hypothetical protein
MTLTACRPKHMSTPCQSAHLSLTTNREETGIENANTTQINISFLGFSHHYLSLDNAVDIKARIRSADRNIRPHFIMRCTSFSLHLTSVSALHDFQLLHFSKKCEQVRCKSFYILSDHMVCLPSSLPFHLFDHRHHSLLLLRLVANSIHCLYFRSNSSSRLVFRLCCLICRNFHAQSLLQIQQQLQSLMFDRSSKTYVSDQGIPFPAELRTLLQAAHVLGVVSFVLWRAVSFKWSDVGSRGVFSRRKSESFRRVRELRRTVSLSLGWVPRKSGGFTGCSNQVRLRLCRCGSRLGEGVWQSRLWFDE